VRPSSPATTARVAKPRRFGGLALAVVLVVSQTAAWLHAIAVAHVTCVEHGESIHAPAPAAASDARGPQTAAAAVVASDDVATVAAHEHCASGALLRWRALAIAPPAATIDLPPIAGIPPGHVPPVAAATTAVYRLAPKTSPPHATV
jgi:hypothetical protein